MQNGVFLAITMPVADAHSVICAQNASSPMLCVAPEVRGIGYVTIMFRCSCLQGFNPHPVLIAKLHSNLAWVQLAGRWFVQGKRVFTSVWSRPGQAIPRCAGAWRAGRSPLMAVLQRVHAQDVPHL